MKNVRLPLPALGVDLLSDETSLPEGTVRRAENVDIARDGGFRRRSGYEVKVGGAGFHSLHHTSRGTLIARDQRVYALNTETFTPQVLCEMGSDSPVDFTEFNGHTYLINHGAFWWIPADDPTPRRVGVSLPAALPNVLAHPNGALTAGTYSVALSRIDDRGEESQTKVLGQISLPNGGGIHLTGMVADLDSSYRVYLTPPDGDVLYLSEEFHGSFTEFVVTRPPDGATRTSQHLKPLPTGDFVRGHGGRIYVAKDEILYFSEPLRPHLHNPQHNFVKFTGRITILEAVEAGMVVGDDRGVWFLPGKDPNQFQLRLVSSAQAVRRSGLKLKGAHFNKELTETDMDVVVWLSTEGYMMARASGDVLSFHPERIRVAAGLEGRSRFVVRNGIKQIITLVAATNGQTYGVAIDTTLQ